MRRRMPIMLMIVLAQFVLPMVYNLIFAVRCAVEGSLLGVILVSPVLIPSLLLFIGLCVGSKIAWYTMRVLILLFLLALPVFLLALAVKGVQLPVPWWMPLAVVVPYAFVLLNCLMLGHHTVRQYCSVA